MKKKIVNKSSETKHRWDDCIVYIVSRGIVKLKPNVLKEENILVLYNKYACPFNFRLSSITALSEIRCKKI